jgi:hypothetical protein
MKTYWRTAAAVAALAASLTLGALLPATPGHTQVARTVVRVLQNGPNDAVPVTLQGAGSTAGNVNVVNTPNVNVANTPNVNVVSLPAVQVNSSVANPLFTRNVNDAVQPVQRAIVFQFNGNSVNQAAFAVPMGKRFVLEDLSGFAFVQTGQKVTSVKVSMVLDGFGSEVEATPVFAASLVGGLDRFGWGRLARGYAGPGTTVGIQLGRDSNMGNAGGDVTISGYFADQ